MFKQQIKKKIIFLTQISRFIFSNRTSVKKRTFAMLSFIENERFCKRRADFRNKFFMITVLRLSFISRFIARDDNKRLKLMTSIIIFEEIRSKRLQTVIVISQHRIQKLIRRFENYEDFEKKL